MKKAKLISAKRSFFMSVLSLILCFAMLLGTTYAWFTDSVTSGVNQIKAGNLDVELYHKDKALASGEAEKVTETTTLFDDVTLWEPGAYCYETFTVKNVGNLALEYSMSLTIANANEIGDHSLNEVLKVKVVDSAPTSRPSYTDGVALKDWSIESAGELLPEGEDDTFTVVVFWEPTDNDNLYNMNNANHGKTLSVDLGVKLVATQLTYEEDSFDDQYDFEAKLTKNGDGTFTNEEGETLIKEEGEYVEVKAIEETPGLYVPKDAGEGSVEKQYATTAEAVQAAIEKVNDEAVEGGEKETFDIVLVNDEYDNMNMVFKRENNKDVHLSAPARTTIKADGCNAVTVNSNSSYHGNSEIVIENIDFELSNKAIAITFGNAGGSDATRYVDNVIVKNCTATTSDGTDTQFVNSPSKSGTKAISIVGCTVNGGHSLFNGYITDLLVDGCTCNAARGVNNAYVGTTIKNSTFNCTKYVVRTDWSPVTIINSTLKTTTSVTDGDEGALVLRGNAPTADAMVTLSNVTFDTPNGYDIVANKITVSKAFITGAPEGTEFVGTAGGSFTN